MSAPDSASLQWRTSTAHRPVPSSARLQYTVLDLLGLSKRAPPKSSIRCLGVTELELVDRYPHLACAEKRVRSLNDDNLP